MIAMFRVSKDKYGVVRTICDDFHQAKGSTV